MDSLTKYENSVQLSSNLILKYNVIIYYSFISHVLSSIDNILFICSTNAVLVLLNKFPIVKTFRS